MTDADLDARCARLRGWIDVAVVSNPIAQIPPVAVGRSGPDQIITYTPRYSTSLDACAELETGIERLGLGMRYARVLSLADAPWSLSDGEGGVYWDNVFALITAPPRARAEAFCRVMESEEANA